MLIFTAVHSEARAVRKALRSAGALDAVRIFVIGIRAMELPQDLSAGVACGIILAGFAGALDPKLQIGDVVVDGVLPQGHGASTFLVGPIHTASDIAATPAQKSSLLRETGAIAVDMEGAKVRRFADSLGVPFLNVRAISDTAMEMLDPAVLSFVDTFGGIRPRVLARGLVCRPNLIPALIRLGRNSRLAGIQLGKAVVQLVASNPFGT